MPIAREGWPFIIAAVILTAMAYGLGGTGVGHACLVLVALLVNFFRDPRRTVPQDPRLILSPADGRVVRIQEAPPGAQGPDGRQISIFLSIFDVHVNRSPIAGRIVNVAYNPGAFLPAFNEKASLRNEQNQVTVQNGAVCVVFTQIAGLIARRIVFGKRVGDEVAQGERVGMIRFGSRVDVFLPAQVEVSVKVGDYVKGGLSTLGTLP